ncbi:patatin-like phospholipase family protein [Parvicella tangerina]|uniref:PNPLA domain-containing protein n=1 Tax=Parvicella tangerina TaxID=2829795 RepID=A0A916JM98_9FLAO|nr:patatin-like phospholipase family protein [Parvicella tangerina]CAG5082592.1 hypothetical protein CRYO30217_01959 [Parvicella tangerina]
MKSVFVLICLIPQLFQAQIKNLVLEGGGVRGIAYVGAIQALEEFDQLHSIENIAGTSVGSIAATLLCIGFNSHELQEELSSIKIQQFNDGRGIFIGGIHRTNKQYGWYKGEKLTDWINDLIEQKTGFKNLTFEQLSKMADTSETFKHLYVTATNLTQQRPVIINHNSYPNMRIADAVRVSTSIPLYYSAVFVDSCGNLYSKPPKDIAVDVLSDGGFLTNYPIHVFDAKYSIEQTIGLRLDDSNQIKQDTSGKHQLAPYEINNLVDYIGAFYNLVIENLNRCDLTPEDWERTISISTCGIGPRVKRLSEEEVNTLIVAGYHSVKKFLSDNQKN